MKKIRKSIFKIRKDTDKICDDYLTKIYVKIKEYVNNYPEINWDNFKDDILKSCYNCLEEVYAYVSKSLKELYKEVEDFDIKDINDLTYQKDGKTLEDRISEHLKNAKEKLDNKEKLDLVILYILNRITVILVTETRMVEQAVKKNKKPIIKDGYYGILVIDGCGGDCNGDCPEYNGIYPEDAEIPIPPYHPNCGGISYYDITNDPDEIEELDLDSTDLDDLN